MKRALLYRMSLGVAERASRDGSSSRELLNQRAFFDCSCTSSAHPGLVNEEVSHNDFLKLGS